MELADSVLEELWFGDEDPARTQQEASRSLAAAAGIASGLKPFPASALRAMKLLSDPEVNAVEVQVVIEQDPSLAMQLLRIANSALFATAVPCASVRDAIVRLGLRQVGEIVAGVATMSMFKDVAGFGTQVREHSVGVAAVARVLAKEWGQKKVEDVFLCGLLHDVGKLLSLQVNEIDYKSMTDAVLQNPDEVHQLERLDAGYDHAVLGAHVMHAWRIPDRVCRVVALHHQPGRAYAEGSMVGLQVAFTRLANTLDYQLRRTPELDLEFIERLASGGEAAYSGLRREHLEAMWPRLNKAREELKSTLG